ncbi:hypothetical protein Ga0074812_1714 [Parafrankia irregularis]|uniref:Glycosyl transferase family 2 n=1 Tax=Parafrankia irregularis TaxID=795642 RepID=A0A0S4R0C2_9ACTN|nr:MULTISPECIES: hypothetical protein [Parafrankia]MBE3206611.1 hypothetical protein [Parafrankia sp. CH37]MBE3206617.1 hypothetical protein [Parafrankia sp. CH37]MBE3206623.1 hypothetical protein [Parafrankia sp. CH37]MBE3206733.1 hypothetical protein [Parafrankia sp. CH37]CUU61269.1 hypothetical protein Ga0074812_1714 [Parafrankia irregularis]
MNQLPTLVAVIGPVEPHLLSAFIDHYRALGIGRFLIGFHFPSTADPDLRAELLTLARNLLGTPPAFVNEGPWHGGLTNAALRDKLRSQAGGGWHLLADIDELQSYTTSLSEEIDRAERSGSPVVGGVMLDRVTADGKFRSWTSEIGLDRSYPLGGFLTHELLRGDPRKIVLVRSGVRVDIGNHRSPDHRPINRPRIVIHHFKWRGDVIPYLAERAEKLGTGQWREESPALWEETLRLLSHVDAHGGGLDVSGDTVLFRPVTLGTTPSWWAPESGRIVDTWRPHARRPS